jgi:hypothetical protein
MWDPYMIDPCGSIVIALSVIYFIWIDRSKRIFVALNPEFLNNLACSMMCDWVHTIKDVVNCAIGVAQPYVDMFVIVRIRLINV